MCHQDCLWWAYSDEQLPSQRLRPSDSWWKTTQVRLSAFFFFPLSLLPSLSPSPLSTSPSLHLPLFLPSLPLLLPLPLLSSLYLFLPLSLYLFFPLSTSSSPSPSTSSFLSLPLPPPLSLPTPSPLPLMYLLTEGVNFESFSAYEVADLVKLYFRELPEPLISPKLTETLIVINESELLLR